MMNETAVYKHTAAYALEHGELEQYRASLQANIACKNAIEAAIRQYFDGMHLNEVAVTEVMSAYGKERICYVIANTLQQKSWDGRFSPSNKEWLAGTVNMGAYLRKMAIDGYVLRLDLPELREMISLLRRCSGNLNQIAKRANESGRIYVTDLAEIQEQLNGLWNTAREILLTLSKAWA